MCDPVHARKESGTLIIGDTLGLLRAVLPWLGSLLVIVALVGGWGRTLTGVQVLVIAGLGLAAALWSMRVKPLRFEFDPVAQQVRVIGAGKGRAEPLSIAYREIREVVAQLAEGYRQTDDHSLGRLNSFRMLLVTDQGEFLLSLHLLQGLADCEQFERPIWEALGRTPPGPLLRRSYEAAVARRDRLQAIALRRLLEPTIHLTEAERRVRTDMERR
jgi:hypothetical protein